MTTARTRLKRNIHEHADQVRMAFHRHTGIAGDMASNNSALFAKKCTVTRLNPVLSKPVKRTSIFFIVSFSVERDAGGLCDTPDPVEKLRMTTQRTFASAPFNRLLASRSDPERLFGAKIAVRFSRRGHFDN